MNLLLSEIERERQMWITLINDADRKKCRGIEQARDKMRVKLEETARKENSLKETISELEELNYELEKRVRTAERNEKSAVKMKKRQTELADRRLQCARDSELVNVELKDEIISLRKQIDEKERSHVVELEKLEGEKALLEEEVRR
jgi:hypothetical protein